MVESRNMLSDSDSDVGPVRVSSEDGQKLFIERRLLQLSCVRIEDEMK
jgi:hypothetical protein